MTEDDLTLSVVIPCRDEAELLPLQLAALRSQVVEGWIDTIVVDDGSTDGTYQVAEAHGEGLPGLKVLRQPPRGRSAALNHGTAASRGTAVLFVDGDDEVGPGYLAAMRRALREHPFVAGRLDHDTLNPPWLRRGRPPVQTSALCHEPQAPWPVASGGALGVQRAPLIAIDGYDTALTHGEDTDLCWRLALAGVPLVFVPEATVHYRHRRRPNEAYAQARSYGRAGVMFDHRYGSGRSLARIGARTLRLLALSRRLLRWRDPSVRVATAYEAGQLAGWLEASLRPRRFFAAEALRPIRPAAPSTTRDERREP